MGLINITPKIMKNYKRKYNHLIKRNFLFLWAILYVFNLTAQKTEREYSQIINCAMGGISETGVINGRVDILTDDYAIEIDFANKWKESIGQALWYSLQTNRKPGIILILRTQKDWKYFQQLNSAIAHGGMTEQFKVWAYPNDFEGKIEGCKTAFFARKPVVPDGAKYWLNLGSNSRHNKSCTYFNNTKRGRFCTAEEGKACGKCGG